MTIAQLKKLFKNYKIDPYRRKCNAWVDFHIGEQLSIILSKSFKILSLPKIIPISKQRFILLDNNLQVKGKYYFMDGLCNNQNLMISISYQRYYHTYTMSETLFYLLPINDEYAILIEEQNQQFKLLIINIVSINHISSVYDLPRILLITKDININLSKNIFSLILNYLVENNIMVNINFNKLIETQDKINDIILFIESKMFLNKIKEGIEN